MEYQGYIFIFSFKLLHDHYFLVHFNIAYILYHQESGVPQGLDLSVTLFAITINVMVDVAGPSTSTSVYLDNMTIYYSS
jgi:hypothetical protein